MQIDPETGVAKNARILIVDDQEANINMVSQILSRAGYAICISISDSADALSKFADLQPDLVLLDWHMCPISGLDFLQTIKSQFAGAMIPPVIVLTADNSAVTRREALAVGASDFLSKPLDCSEVLLRIRNVLQIRFYNMEALAAKENLEALVRERTAELTKTLAELKGVQQQVIQQERLRALGAMAAGVAHDFNNSLMIIRGYSDMFTEDPIPHNDPEQLRECFQTIRKAAEDAGNIVGRLREFYRPYRKGEEDRRSVDLNAIAREAMQLTRPKWQTQPQAQGLSIEVALDLCRGLPIVSACAGEIREALMNLIFNAVDAMPQGGRITIRTAVEEGYANLEVEDSGTGMTEETRRHCLEPFYTTKGERGTGLGLALVYGIIHRHDGLIRINTELNHGTQFTVSLPLSSNTQVEIEKPAIAFSQPLNVLVVDDQPEIRRVLTRYLEQDLHHVVTAENGCDALEKFRAEPFDLVITDRAMPKMNGDQLASAIKEIAPDERVILLTAFDDARRLSQDIDLLLSKPASLQMIRQATAKVFAPKLN